MFPEITVSGSPFERGRAYGAATAPLVRHSIASYARLFASRRGLDWAASQAEARRYLPLLADLTPDLLEEMRGIAAGSGRTLDEILALNVRTELMAGIGAGAYHSAAPAALARNRAAGVPEHSLEPGEVDRAASLPHTLDGECTSAAATGPGSRNGRTLLAQTWDWQGDQRAACVMLRIHSPGKPSALTMTEAGMLAKVGLNSAGIAVGLNLLRSHADGSAIGMPVHVLLRKLLQARSFGEARAMADLATPAGSSCITVAAASGELVSLELTPAGVAEVWASEGLLAHANHCVDAGAAAGECPLEPVSTSRERQGRAWAMLQAAAGQVDEPILQAILTDHADAPRCICRHPDKRVARLDRGESICGLILDPATGVIQVAPDVPCQVPFTPVTL
ncbi:MAG: C45 family autoproteolytic acyltransferase/hydrolase [Oscillochloridaceae bacterium umkhey_bin13]